MQDTKTNFSLLSAEEIAAAKKILVTAGIYGQNTRIAYMGLEDPNPQAPGRRVRAMLMDRLENEPKDVVLDLSTGKIETLVELDPGATGQLPVLVEEFEMVEAILAKSEEWAAALAKRNLKPEQVRVAPLSAGVFEYPQESGRRILRGLAFRQDFAEDSAWAHPVDGLVVYLDTIAGTVDQLLDFGIVPVPETHGNYTDPELTGPVRTTQRPIEITQPEGASFTVTEGNHVEWEKWSLDIGFDMREGLVLYNIAFDDQEQRRRILDRASIAEMVVPYGDPSPVRSWQNYFDTGEYLVGRFANSLELGCDCLGEIHYISPVITDANGEAQTITNGICMHEEDASILAKHSDDWSGVKYTRRNRRLVISFFTTVGNYDYGFYWYLYLDGTIEFEAKATGVVFTSAMLDERFASEMAPGLGAPFHQHIFGARLDFALDGGPSQVIEEEAVRLPISAENPRGNAFSRSHTVLATEQQAVRDANMAAGRSWVVTNPESKNYLGKPVGYKLMPQGLPTLLAAEGSSVQKRAEFASKALWVTQRNAAQRYPTGDFVNQNPGVAGIGSWIEEDKNIDGEAVSLWHTFALTHFPRTEDWPIMPVDTVGFKIRPEGFFDRSPALDVPEPAKHGCCSTASDSAGGCCSTNS
ncbi:histamine oxidase [Arthrobacter sp. MYb211]|uniref:primary-amine oxidase n=1 Tax=Micrococcaceae TaxID=1268 RepID=UPI000CFD085C|nr:MULTISPECIES: primary-amine oxidase [unclassified Arthrobacter]PQZ99673.1 histamine oxidase [Arthrobacter sp. MYb224]PRA05860.1 histamine oxidase [Arthrobacter sp. MYb229]PRA11368.1 histamine oxidase [Arthrobacter sp. MYb221]PRB52761.1 histamine oxidase [Arthrobacter sp. MYb216]PRC07459.1 histamine oxidase [Arthrobacter sp. MYb211]